MGCSLQGSGFSVCPEELLILLNASVGLWNVDLEVSSRIEEVENLLPLPWLWLSVQLSQFEQV